MTIIKARTLVHDELVIPGTGASGRVAAGQVLRIVDVERQQVADFCSFMADRPDDYCDMTYTTFKAETWKVNLGDQLVSKRLEPMWTIVADASNVYYAGEGFCSRELNRLLGVDQHGCRDTLEEQMQKLGLSPLHLNPAACFNVFMNFPYDATGGIEVKVPNTKRGNGLTSGPRPISSGQCPSVTCRDRATARNRPRCGSRFFRG